MAFSSARLSCGVASILRRAASAFRMLFSVLRIFSVIFLSGLLEPLEASLMLLQLLRLLAVLLQLPAALAALCGLQQQLPVVRHEVAFL